MSNPYVGEIRIFAGNFAPLGWALCDGQLVPIAENDVLFQLIGTTYGGDGQSTFGLPDLRSRIPVHNGQGPGQPAYVLGQLAGVEDVTISTPTYPTHAHTFQAVKDLGADPDPTGRTFARITAGDLYGSGKQTLVAMNAAAVGPSPGGAQPHTNMMPYQCLNFIISLFGIFPPRS
jgi:microcystin-dependent protein